MYEQDHQDASYDPMDEADLMLQELTETNSGSQSVEEPSILSTNNEQLENALHTRNQRMILDSLLDTRIRMQQALLYANKLPQNDSYQQFLDQDAELSRYFSEAKESLGSLLQDLIQMKMQLISHNEQLGHLEVNPPKDNQMDTLWNTLCQLEESMEPFVEETVTKWHQRVQISSGNSLLANKFKAVNQSIWSQINQLLMDKDALRQRTQLQRTEYRILGKASNAENDKDQHDKHLSHYDKEIFDDTDFYQLLLKEVIEGKSRDPMLAQQLLRHDQRIHKKQKNVDRKASKGRKIRYVTHEKLVGFMAPTATEEQGNELAWNHQELYRNLFGNA